MRGGGGEGECGRGGGRGDKYYLVIICMKLLQNNPSGYKGDIITKKVFRV